MAQKITNWLLVTLIICLGFGQLLRFEYHSITFYSHDMIIIFFLLCNWSQFTKVTLPKSLKIFGVGVGLSWLYALTQYQLIDLGVPLLYTLRLLAYLMLYLIIKKRQIYIPRPIFLLSGLMAILIGLVQYVLMPDMRWAQYLGWDDHLNRLTLPHFDPTFTAIMLSLLLLSTTTIGRSVRTTLVPFFSLLAILLSYSRSVWLSLTLTASLFIKNKIVLLLAVCGMSLAIIALPQKFGEGNNLLRTYSITSRWGADMEYINKYRWDLLIGRGLNTLPLDNKESKYSNHATGPNNSYLYLLATTGLIGLIGWLMFMRDMYRSSQHQHMLLFFLIGSLFNNVMFYPFALLWILLIHANKIKQFENL